jgi:membrane associated rhomboid family serine protease
MGIYDRDYYRQQERSFSVRAPGTMVGTILLINVAIYIADYFTPETRGGAGRLLSDMLAVHVATLTQPWLWWQFLSYGFTHSPLSFQHILFNMLALWFLGQDIEYTYGRKEFLRLYLVLLVLGGLAWALVNKLQGRSEEMVYGASGAVAGIVVLYALNFPRRTLLLFFVLPVPAWLCGVLLVAGDILGALGKAGESHVAYTIHLAGAAFAFLYYRQRWNLGRLVEGRLPWPRLRRPRLRLHRPQPPPLDLNQQVDRILEKIHREGESSLTRKERQILEDASREYQKRRHE